MQPYRSLTFGPIISKTLKAKIKIKIYTYKPNIDL